MNSAGSEPQSDDISLLALQFFGDRDDFKQHWLWKWCGVSVIPGPIGAQVLFRQSASRPPMCTACAGNVQAAPGGLPA